MTDQQGSPERKLRVKLDFPTMSDAQLHAVRMDKVTDLAEAKCKIDRVLELKNNGEEINSDFLFRLKRYKVHTEAELSAANIEHMRRCKLAAQAEKEGRDDRYFAQKFVEAAQEILSEETIDLIKAQAQVKLIGDLRN